MTYKETIAFISDMIDCMARKLSIMSVMETNPTTELALSVHRVTILDFIYIHVYKSMKFC